MAAAPPPQGQAAPPVVVAAAAAQPVAVAPNFYVNRPGEPECQLKIEPEKLVFKSDKITETPLSVELKVTNPTKKRQCFKVRCTSNDVFRVRPPLGFIKANETISINVLYESNSPPDQKHFLAFYHVASEENKTPRAIWTPTTKTEGVKRIACLFVKEDGTLHGTPPVTVAVAQGQGAQAFVTAAPPVHQINVPGTASAIAPTK
ncbi:Major sperm protein [Aphelenchoides besseyi]|nr:Major sperm protein [Aphelenchoides besseyi]